MIDAEKPSSGDISSIVSRFGNSSSEHSCDLNLRSFSTRPTREFEEFYAHLPVDTQTNSSMAQTSLTSTERGNTNNNTIDSRHSELPMDIGDQSCHPTTTQQQTERPAQRTQRVHTLDSRNTDNIQELQHSIPNINIPLARPLLTTPTPPTHTATAAEIALGISPSYNLQHQQAMGTSARPRNLHLEAMQGNRKQRHIVENISEVKDASDAENTSLTSAETGAVSSPGRSTTPMHDSSEHEASDIPRNMIGTPSTVSTAPSTDDASLGTDYKLDDLPNLLRPGIRHQRSGSGSSWGEEGLLPGGLQIPLSLSRQAETANPWGQPSQRSWAGVPSGQQPQQRVASFRYGNEGSNQKHPNNAWSPQQPPRHHFQGDQHIQYYQQHQQHRMEPRQQQGYPHNPNFASYQQQQQRKAFNQAQTIGTRAGVMAPAPTPPRNTRGQRPQGQVSSKPIQSPSSANSPHQGLNTNPQRSSSEILKTLLRKKACLYEPDTSRAVALVTWLVGRELAIEYGFFSRQQLQSGVHACVASKIDGGIITRTKVNRCMQIILNSCFHYIIPRSDGTEEKGDYFREGFAKGVKDDSFMLRYLSRLWNDVTVDRDTVLQASLNDGEEKLVTTPKSSPKLSSQDAPKSPPKDLTDHDHYESKRAVLLCFNENVRSAEDVFRCHNEFIRDTANAAHLQLTSQEWQTFFGREAGHGLYLLGKVGIPMSTHDAAGGPDLLGRMSPEEAGKFRTSWCSKRYDHDHDLCGFSHVEVNGGWLRRNPMIFPYKDEMCSFISKFGDKENYFFVNECPKGLRCDKAHSTEELIYHPNRYKLKVCSSVHSPSGACSKGDICPHLHPQDVTRPPKKPSEKTFGPRHAKRGEPSASVKASTAPPMAAPVVYASPAPFSSFERQLLMPGLQNLYRRHSSVIRAHVRTSGNCKCSYSCFGDDLGISSPVSAPESRTGLPSARRVS